MELIELVVTQPGTTLRVRRGLFRVERGEEVNEVSPLRVRSLVLAAPARLTTDVLRRALEHNIDVLVLDRRGTPIGRFWTPSPGATATLRRRQLQAAEAPLGRRIARDIVVKKLEAQAEYLRELARRRKDPAELLAGAEFVRSYALRARSTDRPDLAGLMATLRGYEGTASRRYFSVLNELLPRRWRFATRSRRPANDGFNALLNYAYGVLRGKTERAVLLAGLDPYLGFVHADSAAPTLVLDLLELVRTEADRAVVGLFTRRRVKEAHFERGAGEVRLSREGKRVLLEALGARLDRRMEVRGRKIRREDSLQLHAHALAKKLREWDPTASGDDPPGDGEGFLC